MTKTSIVPGSLSAIAQLEGASLAETFLGADAVLLVDMSGSMAATDAPQLPGRRLEFGDAMPAGRSRYDAAEDELRRLQAELPGKVAVVAFSTFPEFCPGGVPPRIGAGTNMAEALRFIKPVDGCGVKIILISDGQPDNHSETMAEARKFQTPIETLYIGPANSLDGGEEFLYRLAVVTGGQAHKSKAPGLLQENVRQLLTAG